MSNSVVSHQDNLLVIIRSSGERTLSLCQSLIQEQVPKENILVIQEAPFSQAVRRTFEIGMDYGFPWTLAIDADVLLREGAISDLMMHADQTDANVFEIQGLILDKFFGGIKPAGNHLFRTALCDVALDHIPEDGISMRPETYTLKSMANAGYPWQQLDIVLGLHDYKQFYRDIYRKAFVHAHKHRRYISLFESMWNRKMENDADFRIASSGLRAGQIYDGMIQLDSRQSSFDISTLLQAEGLVEKPTLVCEDLTGKEIARKISTDKPEAETMIMQQMTSEDNKGKLIKRLQMELTRRGLLRFGLWGFGMALRKIADRLVNLAS